VIDKFIGQDATEPGHIAMHHRRIPVVFKPVDFLFRSRGEGDATLKRARERTREQKREQPSV
jgi:hypothetical protein